MGWAVRGGGSFIPILVLIKTVGRHPMLGGNL